MPGAAANRPLLIVDGDNLAHRAYHSTPKSVVNKEGVPINAFVGFFGMLLKVFLEERPRAIFVAWDTLGVDTYRSELWPPYQGGRAFDQELIAQLNGFPRVCDAFGFGVGKEAGCEADDLMASAAMAEVRQGGTCLILTADRDAYQVVSESITVLAPVRGAKALARIGPREVVQRMGVLPEQVPDFKALSGDSSDSIPGIRGIGPVAASSLLLKHGTLEGVLAAWADPAKSELALRFREVVRMRCDVHVVLPERSPDWVSGSKAVRELGAETLAKRLEAL